MTIFSLLLTPGWASFRPNLKEAVLVGCDLCEKAMFEAFSQAQEHAAEVPKQGTLDESAVHNILEKLCDPKTLEGRWLQALDLVSSTDVHLTAPGTTRMYGAEDESILGSSKEGFYESVSALGHSDAGFLLVKDHAAPGKCEEECTTLRFSCDKFLEVIFALQAVFG